MPAPSPRMRALCDMLGPLIDGMIGVWTEQLDRKQPMSGEMVVLLNDLLHHTRRVLGREPGEALLKPLPEAGPVMPADGYLRLVQARYLLDRLVERHGHYDAEGGIVWEGEGANRE